VPAHGAQRGAAGGFGTLGISIQAPIHVQQWDNATTTDLRRALPTTGRWFGPLSSALSYLLLFHPLSTEAWKA
jgi:hypothetical protein